jgi:SPX domain protein involved in polyphosphate accumulation
MAPTLREGVESELRHFMELDPFVRQVPGHQYLVRSLYFDDPSFTTFYDKIDGLHSRSKFRVRTYTNDPDVLAPRFLEIKGRHNNLVYKHRVLIDINGVEKQAATNGIVENVLQRTPVGPMRSQFEFELHRKRIRPVALVDYQRRPYVSKYDPEFRLTFDQNLHAVQSNALFPSERSRSRRLLPGLTVMEVKFRYHIPAWFHRIIQAYELQRVSVSKICEAITALGLAENLS